MLQLGAKAIVSLDENGAVQFDEMAIKEFRGRDIAFIAFNDWRTGRSAMRTLVDAERNALEITNPDFCAEVRGNDCETPRAYLRAVGIKVRKGRRYEALLTHQGNGIIVTIS